MSGKFDEDMHNNLVAILFTRIRRDARMDGRTDGTTAALLYPLRNAGIKIINSHSISLFYKYFKVFDDLMIQENIINKIQYLTNPHVRYS